MIISRRKLKHLQIALRRDVRFKTKTTGFEKYELVHCALPEIDYNKISTQIQFLGKELSFPLMISPMTGGCAEAQIINRQLAEVSTELQIALSIGSQRQLLENDKYIESYRIARQVNPNGVVIGNVGAAQLVDWKDPSLFQKMIDVIQADALTVHLNPLQEALQPHGDVHFKGVLSGIERLVQHIDVPIIVKEVGSGISEKVAKRLVDAGVSWIDTAGAGGTSWAAVEHYRSNKKELAKRFWDWGIPTAESLQMVRAIPGIQIIASGGIDNGITMTKAVALGANLCGIALPVLKVLIKKKKKGLLEYLTQLKTEFQTAMFLTGCCDVFDLQKDGVIKRV